MVLATENETLSTARAQEETMQAKDLRAAADETATRIGALASLRDEVEADEWGAIEAALAAETNLLKFLTSKARRLDEVATCAADDARESWRRDHAGCWPA
jgi:two-component sensor histidine kinase